MSGEPKRTETSFLLPLKAMPWTRQRAVQFSAEMRNKTKYLWPFFRPSDLLCVQAWATDCVSQLNLKGLPAEIFPSSGTRLAAILGSWVVINPLTSACMFMGVLMGSWVRLCQGWTSHLLYHKLIHILKFSCLLKWLKVNPSPQNLKSLMSAFRVSLSHSLFISLTVLPVIF